MLDWHDILGRALWCLYNNLSKENQMNSTKTVVYHRLNNNEMKYYISAQSTNTNT